MEHLFSCSTRYQEIIAVYILLLNTSATHSELKTRREIPYQHAPMYYSLPIEGGQIAEFVIQPRCKILE